MGERDREGAGPGQEHCRDNPESARRARRAERRQNREAAAEHREERRTARRVARRAWRADHWGDLLDLICDTVQVIEKTKEGLGGPAKKVAAIAFLAPRVHLPGLVGLATALMPAHVKEAVLGALIDWIVGALNARLIQWGEGRVARLSSLHELDPDEELLPEHDDADPRSASRLGESGGGGHPALREE